MDVCCRRRVLGTRRDIDMYQNTWVSSGSGVQGDQATVRMYVCVCMYVLYTAWYRVKVGERDEGTSLSKQAIDFQFPTVIAPLVPT